MSNFDDFKLAIEAMSGGKNTVILDDLGMPSVMVPFAKQKMSALISGGSENVHPGFSVNGAEKDAIYVSKFQNVVINDRAYSLPMRDPKVSVTFDNALTYCRNKGNGWCMLPYSVWSAIALWCRANGTMPRGNNNWGHDISYDQEVGVQAITEPDISNYPTHEGDTARTLTGSGPATWYHNWMPDGIADLNGNILEWCAGMRLYAGEIQIIPYANCFDPDISMAASSEAWKAILADGTLTDPGSDGTLKLDYISSKLRLISGDVSYTTDATVSCTYQSMTIEDGLDAPELAKALLLYPDEPGGDYGGDYHYANLTGERLPGCGGGWRYGANAGVFCVDLYYTRSYSNSNRGFRSAYCDL